MNKYFTPVIIGLLLTATSFVKAQDIITLKNGTQLKGTVTDVTPTTVKYIKQGADTTPVVLAKKDILVVDYKDGSTLMLNNVAPKDNVPQYTNFIQRFFVTVGTGVTTITKNTDGLIYTPLNNYIPANVSAGVALSNRVALNAQLDYNPSDNIVSGKSYLISGSNSNTGSNYSFISESYYYNLLTLIPNIIISANPHKFTPYGRAGVLIRMAYYTGNSIYIENYQNAILSSTERYTNSITNTNLDDMGTFIAAGCNWKLSKRFSVYGEAYYKGAIFINGSELFNGDGSNPSSGGVNLGLKITM